MNAGRKSNKSESERERERGKERGRERERERERERDHLFNNKQMNITNKVGNWRKSATHLNHGAAC